MMGALLMYIGGWATLAASISDITRECVTTEEALQVLLKAGLLEQAMQYAIDKISYYISKRSDRTAIEVIMFSNEQGELARTPKAMEYLEEYRLSLRERKGEK